jgi:hypothetical protein
MMVSEPEKWVEDMAKVCCLLSAVFCLLYAIYCLLSYWKLSDPTVTPL